MDKPGLYFRELRESYYLFFLLVMHTIFYIYKCLELYNPVIYLFVCDIIILFLLLSFSSHLIHYLCFSLIGFITILDLSIFSSPSYFTIHSNFTVYY